MIFRIDNNRQEQLLGISARKTGITVGVPLHRGAHAIPITKVVVITHANLIAVVEHRCSRQ